MHEKYRYEGIDKLREHLAKDGCTAREADQNDLRCEEFAQGAQELEQIKNAIQRMAAEADVSQRKLIADGAIQHVEAAADRFGGATLAYIVRHIYPQE